jgi:putative tryptophan/tyrosine transport system substrate-binding protein
MKPTLRRFLWGLLLAMPPSASTAVEQRILIVREDSAVARQATELLVREVAAIGWASADVGLKGDRAVAGHVENEQVLVAFGSRAFAAALRHAAGKPVIGALLAQSSVDDLAVVAGDHWSAIVLDQPVDRWINLIQTAFTGMQQIGMLASPASQKTARAMERKMADRRLTLAIETVSSAAEVVPAIDRLTPRMGVLLAMPDPLVHNRNTVQPLLLTTYRAGIPVVAYSESYQQAGAVLALYSSVPQVVTQVVESLQQIRDGKPLPNNQSPRYFTVGINSAVAQSLGLALPTAGELDARLRSLAQ